MTYDEPSTRIMRAHENLAATGALEPVEVDASDGETWLNCDLASLAENRLGDEFDPRRLDAPRRADWLARATRDKAWPLRARTTYERPYWICEGGLRVGTIALAMSTLGGTTLRLSSFYLFPEARNRGIGKRTLDLVRAVLAAQELGIRLETYWTWTRAVGFYLRAGLWVRMWKREVDFCAYPSDPKPIIEIAGDRATLSVDHPSRGRMILDEATRDGEKLVLAAENPAATDDPALGESPWHARSTLSVALALAGWPLIRSQEDWNAARYADAAAPEALAYKITLWEAWEHKHGWRVNTPRIPGLAYPTWADHEARWALEERERESKKPAPK